MDWQQTIKRILEKEIEEQHLAGANIVVYHKNQEAFYHQSGMADMENQIRIKRDTIFRIFSMTKPITSVAVMMLVDRGELDLLDPVSKFLPEYQKMQICENGKLHSAQNEITIRDLLQMTSGLVYSDEPGMCGQSVQAVYDKAEALRGTKDSLTTREMAYEFSQTPLHFEPGTDWYYGVSADVLGAVVEVVSGKSFGTFLKENIFDVLGMVDTGFYVPPEKYHRLANAYRPVSEHKLEKYTTNYLAISIPMDSAPSFESGGAGLVSTIDDYGKFARMLLNEGEFEGKRLLSRAAISMMRHAGLSEQEKGSFTRYSFNQGFTYGFLMRNMIAPSNSYQYGSIGEYGWEGWLGSYFFVDPEDDLTMVFMTQDYNGGYLPAVRRIRNVLFSAIDDL